MNVRQPLYQQKLKIKLWYYYIVTPCLLSLDHMDNFEVALNHTLLQTLSNSL